MVRAASVTLVLWGPVALGQQAVTSTAANVQLVARVQAKLDSIHRAGRFPGATAAFVLADGSAFAVATGQSDTSRRATMTVTDRLMQGSVGKTYVAAVALQLVHEGKLGLDEKIETYLGREPWLARLPNARDITVRMLMNHTSGLVRYEFKEQFARDLTANADKTWRPEELVSYILDTAAPFAAGQGWDYSDTNYIVLGMIIERLTGATYYDELHRRLLRPLALENTVPTNTRAVPRLVQGYAGANNPFGGTDAMIADGQFVINPQFEWTGGGIASTSLDLARWAKALYEGRAFHPSMLPVMLTGVPARLGPNAQYGLGVIIRPTPLGTSYGHSGFFPGYQAEMMYFPDLRLAAAFQVNTSVQGALGRSPGRVLLELVEVVSRGGS